jgi:uncharacterized protein
MSDSRKRVRDGSGRAGATIPPAGASLLGPPTAAALRAGMECVVLAPREGAPRSSRPPVEIFLGTEPSQYRANRVFGYSIEKVRDPGREVRIHLMSELPGFDRRAWTTGFTNYRFAIPALCGGRGRAIYNDEDEIYLADPGLLFDLDLAGAGYLATSDSESSVMLIDCARMAPIWTLEEARTGWKRSLLRKASRATGLRGDLDPHWNARDEEFVPGRSHLLHYTTLHTQPWRPFPERFVYQAGSYTDLWHELEREAIAHGFELFHRAAPSRAFAAHCAHLERLPTSELPSFVGPSGPLARRLEALVQGARSKSLVELAPDLRGDAEIRPGRFGLDVERRMGLCEWLALPAASGRFEGVVCTEGLDALPVWDVPWIVDSLFARSQGFVFVAVRCREQPVRRFLHPPAGTVSTPEWWRSHFEAAATRHPEVRWELVTTRGRDFDRDGHHRAFGGPRPGTARPSIWTLGDGEPGQVAALAALAHALGGASRVVEPSSPALTAPWPELLIVAGSRFAEPARRIRAAAGGDCLVVALGADAALPIDSVDLGVVEVGETLFPHPRRIEIEGPLVAAAETADAGRSRDARARACLVAILDRRDVVAAPLEDSARTQFAALACESARRLGGEIAIARGRHCADVEWSEFARTIAGAAEEAGVEVREVSGPAFERARAEADAFVLADPSDGPLWAACAAGRPVFVLRSERKPARPGPLAQLRAAIDDAVIARARARPANDRGTTRPQEGLEWLAARWVADGVVRPRRDPDALRDRLLAAGHVRILEKPLEGSDLAGFPPAPPADLPRVAARVSALLGLRRSAW